MAKWVGPYIVERFIDGVKLLELNKGDCFITTFIDKVKIYHTRHTYTKPMSDNEAGDSPDLKELDKFHGIMWPKENTKLSL